MPKARITITLKPTVLDAQGAVVQNALHSLGFSEVQGVHMGRYIELDLTDGDGRSGRVEQMCKQLLANPVIESYHVDITD